MTTIQFYFEIASPYCYVASSQLEQLAAAHAVELDWLPIDIEAVWSAHGVLEAYSAIRRLKRKYIAQDSRRCAAAQGLELKTPITSTKETSLAKLAYWGLRDSQPLLATQFLRAVWHRHFGLGEPISTAQDLAAAASIPGFDSVTIAALAASSRAIAAQRAANADAVRHGCFGIPWFVMEGESFFGQDRTPYLAERLLAKQVRSPSREATP